MTLDNVVSYIEGDERFAGYLPAMQAYREQYGA